MARVTPEQWEKARAAYEVRGVSLTDIARDVGVDRAAVSRRAKREGWEQGKNAALVERKTAAIREIASVDGESRDLPPVARMTLEEAVRERIAAEGLLARLDATLAHRGALMALEAATPAELELLSRVSRNIRPQDRTSQTTVNVSQRQDAGALTPREALAEIRLRYETEAAADMVLDAAPDGADAP